MLIKAGVSLSVDVTDVSYGNFSSPSSVSIQHLSVYHNRQCDSWTGWCRCRARFASTQSKNTYRRQSEPTRLNGQNSRRKCLNSVGYMRQMKTGSGCVSVATAEEISLLVGDLGKSAPRSQVIRMHQICEQDTSTDAAKKLHILIKCGYVCSFVV